MTKKNVLIVAAILPIIGYVIAEYLGKNCFGSHDFVCSYVVGTGVFVFFLSIPILFFSLITYFLKDEIFRSWFFCTKWWILATAVLVLIVPSNDAGGGMLRMSSGGFVALVLFIFYFFFSALLIVYKSINR
jgi:hypothetical protein